LIEISAVVSPACSSCTIVERAADEDLVEVDAATIERMVEAAVRRQQTTIQDLVAQQRFLTTGRVT
jgi:hypothetical protein